MTAIPVRVTLSPPNSAVKSKRVLSVFCQVCSRVPPLVVHRWCTNTSYPQSVGLSGCPQVVPVLPESPASGLSGLVLRRMWAVDHCIARGRPKRYSLQPRPDVGFPPPPADSAPLHASIQPLPVPVTLVAAPCPTASTPSWHCAPVYSSPVAPRMPVRAHSLEPGWGRSSVRWLATRSAVPAEVP